jgi:hypothetical protein
MSNPADAPKPLTEDDRAGLLAEYAALRTEILKRIEVRHQLTAITLTATAAFLSTAIVWSDNSTVALVLPLLIPCLALMWVHNDTRVGDIAKYIRTHIETALPVMSWETEMERRRNAMSGKARWRWTVLFQAIMFIAICVADSMAAESIKSNFLFWVDLASIVLVVVIMNSALSRYSRGKKATASSAPGS